MPPLSKGKRRQGGKEIAAGRRFSLLHSVSFGGVKKSGKGVCFSAEKSAYPIVPLDSTGRRQLSRESPELLLGCSAPATAAQLSPHLRVAHHGIWATKGSREHAGGPEAFFGHCFKPQKHISGNFSGVNV